MTKLASLIPGLALVLAAGLAWADSHEPAEGQMMDHGAMGQMDMSQMPEHMQGMMGAMQTMMQSMPMESSGDPDADFLLMMIPHHQSAIDVARTELEHGDDEETRAMAQAIIDAQEQEIAEMRAMLERMGVDAPAAASE
ncbi:DUF305 domain-containing protein [Rubellimicrobium aerolatum]|uniref:DUF305 domain-containing protein n=1 Tax=Rubellimicrobium aerolatum TaxID=490979 RepID=A0ABW0SDR2_9RHOB|nr:DUF305 domain-containing protein [Rubellimicrobium aerolatum]MBP1807023.1 uncharacterized protein (DUF305 family) [Rubellimicrobium aerolatum]